MKKLLVVVDMQNDFIDGALGTKEAQAIVPNAVKKINEWDGDIAYTFDTHAENYLDTTEGKYLPVKHCVEHTHGWCLNDNVAKSLVNIANAVVSIAEVIEPGFCKPTFGSIELMQFVKDREYDYVELIGLCTDICVISNALMIKAIMPEPHKVVVDASCCAGVTPESHKAALTTMKMCQIEVINND